MDAGRRLTGSRPSGSSGSSNRASSGWASTEVDLYLAHEFDPDVPLAETVGAFEDLQAAGKIRAYGVSNFDAEQLQAALAAGVPQAIQNEHSLMARGDEDDVLPLCVARAGRPTSCSARWPAVGSPASTVAAQPFPAGSRMTQRPEPVHARS